VWLNINNLVDGEDPQQNPSPLIARYREAVIIVVKVENHHCPYDVGARQGVVIVNNSEPVSVYLPDTGFGKMLRVKATGNCSEEAPITLHPPDGKTIDGEASLVLTLPYSSVILVSDETGWLIF
tara:strand:- start:24 stop:395 length:372 start_codon:yes stop_codon:yes gene_type:complete